MNAKQTPLVDLLRLHAEDLHSEHGHNKSARLLSQAADEIDHLRADLERERMRLAACGVVAMANTPESAARARDIHPDYRSASCDDVARAVDSEMSLRTDNAELLTNLDRVLTTLRYLIGIAERGEGRPMADGDRTRDNRNHNSGTDTGAERAGGPFS